MSLKPFLHRLRSDEAGITALETAIILIAFVVVASVFAFTILSAGTFSTERGKEAIYAGLQEVRSSIELKGGVIAEATTAGADQYVDRIIFTVATAMGGEPINLSEADRVVSIEYRDSRQRAAIDQWTVKWLVRNDNDDLLESGELAELTVPITNSVVLPEGLGINTEFTIEVKPPRGAVLNIQRTTPSYIEKVYDLQ